MRFKPEIPTSSLDKILTKAIQIGTPNAWQRRAASCDEQTKSNPFMRPALVEKFSIEMAMERVRQYRKSTGRIPSPELWTPADHRLMAFCAMLSSVYDEVSPKAKKEIEGRLRGGLNDKVGLASLSFELQTAAHLLQAGAEVEWHDLEGSGGYDLLARRNGMEIEVECKTSSGDVGRKIHSVRHYQLGSLIYGATSSVTGMKQRLLIDIVVPDRLNGSDIPAIAERVRACLQTASNFSGPHPCKISIYDFDIGGTPFEESEISPDQDKISKYVRDKFGIERSNFLLNLNSSGNCIVSLGSQRPDSVIDGLYRQIKAGAAQLSGTRPGIICVRLMDVTPEQIIQLCEESKKKPTAFGMMILRLFDGRKHGHVHTISFSTPGVLHRSVKTSSDIRSFSSREAGPSFTIKNKSHPLIDDARLELFDQPYL